MSTDTAVVIIDVQVGLMEDAYRRDEVLAAIQTLLEQARASGAPVLYVQHDGGKGDGLEVNTPPWNIHPAIAPRAGDPVIHKSASDSFYNTTLARELDARGIKHLVVAGGQTDYCVDTSVRRATTFGYDVTLVADAHTTYDNDVLTAQQIIDHTNKTLHGFMTGSARILVKPVSRIRFTGEQIPDDKIDLYTTIYRGYEALQQLLAPLSESQMTTPGANGDWSIKDIIAHIASWQRFLLDRLEAAAKDSTPTLPMLESSEEVDRLNARFYEENRTRSLPEVMNELETTFMQVLKSVWSLPAEALFEADRFPWMQGTPLVALIAGDTYEHYLEHSPAIQLALQSARAANR